jgi:hypothetical protein
MASERYFSSDRPPITAERANSWFACVSFVLSLVFPLTYSFLVVVSFIGHLSQGSNPFVVSLYTIFDYFEWPLPIVAVVLGHIALARGGNNRGIAWAGPILGYVSFLTLIGVVIAFRSP